MQARRALAAAALAASAALPLAMPSAHATSPTRASAASQMCPDGSAGLPWRWPVWGTVATSVWGSNSSCCTFDPTNKSCCSGIDSPEEARFKTSHFDLVFIDNGIGAPGCRFPFVGGNDTTLGCHVHRSLGAAAIKSARPQTPVFVYRQISALLEGANLTAIAPLLVARDDRGNAVAPARLDWRKPEAVDWYVSHVIGAHTANDPHADGVFVDGPLAASELACSENMTLASKRAMMAGLATMLSRVTRLLSAAGKVLTVSLGSHFSNLTAFYPANSTAGYPVCASNAALDSMEPCCGHGEEIFFNSVGLWECGKSMLAPFRQFNIPSRDFGDAAHGGNDTLGCAAAVEDASAEMQSRPAHYCNNDGWPNATDGGVGWGNHNVSLAAYLIASSSFSYFSSGLHWFDLIPNTTTRAWPAWPDFRFPLGRPLGPHTRDGFVFRREFEHADVTLDCGSVTGRIDWKGA